MKYRYKIAIFLCSSLLLIAFPGRVWAQAGSPGDSTPTPSPTLAPADLPKGEITGAIVNKNDSAKSLADLEIMLHVLDKDQNELGTIHGKSTQDGSFKIEDVPFQEGMSYAASVVYAGTTYFSPLVPAEAGKMSLNLEIPVYESTTDLSKVQVAQMHVLFSFAQDGIDIKELYVLSNLGDRTVKDVVDIPGNNGVKATVSFPLPEKADFVNFQPQEAGRFLKFQGGFADVAGIVPGQMVSQFMVGYLLPYTDPLTYQLKTVLPVQALNFVIPKDFGVTLKGAGLGEPQIATAQDGQIYYQYSLKNISAGQTLNISMLGKPNIPKSQTVDSASTPNLPYQTPIFLGLGILGLAIIGGGVFWWIRSSQQPEEEDFEDGDLEGEVSEGDQSEFDILLQRIARLDTTFEQGELDEESYQAQRDELKTQAKAMLAEREVEAGKGETIPSD